MKNKRGANNILHPYPPSSSISTVHTAYKSPCSCRNFVCCLGKKKEHDTVAVALDIPFGADLWRL